MCVFCSVATQSPNLVEGVMESANTVAAATEEQSAVTNDIANNVTMVSELVNGRR